MKLLKNRKSLLFFIKSKNENNFKIQRIHIEMFDKLNLIVFNKMQFLKVQMMPLRSFFNTR